MSSFLQDSIDAKASISVIILDMNDVGTKQIDKFLCSSAI